MKDSNDNVKENNYKAIYKRMANISHIINFEPTSDVEIVMSKTNQPSLRVLSDGKKIAIHSLYNPESEAIKWAESVDVKPNTFYIVFGLGMGYHIRELKKRIDEYSIILVVEPTYDIFCNSLKAMDFTDILEDEKIILIINDTITGITDAIKNACNVIIYSSYSFSFSSLATYTLIYKNIYSDLSMKMKDLFKEAMVSKNTMLFFSQDWQKNLMKNLPHINSSFPLNGFVDKFKDVPAVIVSAGPSLNKNIHLLKNVEDKAVIISTDTALKALFKNNIKPHFVISIDGSIKNFEKYDGVNYDDIPLVFTPKVHWKIINNHKGRKVVFTCGDTYTEYIFRKYDINIEGLSSGGSVANNALHMAVKIGANPIILIGQDLAYTNDKSHAEGTMYDGKNAITPEIEEVYVKDIYGGQVKSHPSYIIFLRWFEEFISNDKSSRKYIDSTEGGAYIKGTEVMPLSDTIREYMTQEHDIRNTIDRLFNENKCVSSMLDIKDMVEFFKKQRTVLKGILKRSKNTYEMCEEASKEYEKSIIDYKKIRDIIKDLDKFDSYLRKKMNDMIILDFILEPVIQNSIKNVNINANNTQFKDEKEKDSAIIGSSFLLYKGIWEAVNYTIPLLNECIERIEELLPNGI